ncbi:NAD(P)-binding domain-containing protein [Fulvivirgaceae bacterium LMO-SS25]
MMIKSISIIGCGWLGWPMAQALITEGFAVKGSTTSPEKLSKLQQDGIEAYCLNFPTNDHVSANKLVDSDLLFINIPPSGSGQREDYPKAIANLISFVKPLQKIIFISSTSIYPNLNRLVTEDDVDTSSFGKDEIGEAELEILKRHQSTSTILRCSGLMGKSRIPGKYFAGKKGLDNGHILLNLVHLSDIIGVVKEIIKQDAFGHIWNLTAPIPRKREEIYKHNAAKFGFAPAEFAEPNLNTPFKVISPNKLISELNYTFKYPDILDFEYDQAQSN